MAVACIDTHILIWGVQRRATPGQEDMLQRTAALLAQLEKDRTQVIVPSVVIGEFLLGLPVDEHPQYQTIVQSKFIVVPYDLRAALHFSRIWHQKTEEKVIEAIKADGATRTQLRADVMIVASALAAGATHIHGHDHHVKRLSEGFIIFEDVATRMVQTTLHF